MSFEDFSGKPQEHYYEGEPHKFNNFWLGFFVFLMIPFITLVVVLLATGAVHYDGFVNLMRFVFTNHSAMFSQIFVASLFPNLIGFYLIYKQERWKMGRGLTVATLLYFAAFIIR